MPRLSTPPALRQALLPLGRRFAALDRRERKAIALAAAVLLLAALWALAVRPAWRTLRETPARLLRAEQQLQDMQLLAADARALRALQPVPRAQALAALHSANQRLGSVLLVEQGERVVLTLDAVPPSALREWLGEVRASARARPVEARLTRDDRGLSGTLVLALGGSA